MKQLLLLGLAAYAYHRYTKMSAEEKTNISNRVKEAGRSITDHLPTQLKDMLGKKNPAV